MAKEMKQRILEQKAKVTDGYIKLEQAQALAQKARDNLVKLRNELTELEKT